MKNKILKLMYKLAYYLDVKLNYIKTFEYETAPYCGHHYNGHKGKYSASHYHEGDGECYFIFLLWVVSKSTEDEDWYIVAEKRLNKFYKRF